jgi:hypothetical protein
LINNRSKIPNTAALLDEIVEPFEQYQVRRLAGSISELKTNHEQLTVSKIVKASGLKSIKDPFVRRFLEEELGKSYCA